MAINSSNNANFTDSVKEAAQKEAQTIILKLLHQISLKISEYVKEYIDDVYASSKQRRLKYKEILKVISSSDSTFKEIQTAMQEANDITKLAQNEMDHLNKLNPLDLVKLPVLSSRYNKWNKLYNSVLSELLERTTNKIKQSATSKQETSFFNDYPQLQNEVSKVNSLEAIESFNVNIEAELKKIKKIDI